MKGCPIRCWTILLIAIGVTSNAAADGGDGFGVGPQYDTTHVYVAAADFDRFVASVLATFGGKASPRGVLQVTPTPSRTIAQLLVTPVGSLSVFGFETPIPYPFGEERGGYLVTDIDAAVAAARKAGATRLVDVFADPIGRDVLVQWPGGITMQLYWHTKASDYPPLITVPEDRVYLTVDAAEPFVTAWTAYSHGSVVSDDRGAPGGDIGLAGQTYRRIRIDSVYGTEAVIVTNGSLPWPYGRERTGYAVDDLDATLARATSAGVEVLVPPGETAAKCTAMLRFPGGYIAEIHAAAKRC